MAKFGENTLLSEAAFSNEADARNQLAQNNLNYDNYDWETQGDMHYATNKKAIENSIESGKITPNQLPNGSAIKKEAEQLYDNNPRNDEVRNDAFDDYILETPDEEISLGSNEELIDPDDYIFDIPEEKDEVRNDAFDDFVKNIPKEKKEEFPQEIDLGDESDYRYKATPVEDSVIPYRLKPGSHWNRKYGEYLDSISKLPTSKKHAAYEIMAKLGEDDERVTAEDLMSHNHWMDSDTAKAIEFMSQEGFNPVVSKDMWNKSHKKAEQQFENWIESNPQEAQEALTAANEPEAAKEAEQVTDGNPQNSEVRNDVMDRLTEDFANVDELHDYLVDWDKVHVYQPGEDPIYQVHDDYDPRVEEMWNHWDDTYSGEGDEVNDLNDDTLDVVDYGLEDQNQYQDKVTEEEASHADDTLYDPDSELKPQLTEDMLEPAPELPYADNVFQVKEQEEPIEASEEEPTEDGNTDLSGILTAEPKSIGGSRIGNVSKAPNYSNGHFSAGNSIGSKGILPHGAIGYSAAGVSGAAPNKGGITTGRNSVGAIKNSPETKAADVVTGKQSESSGFTSGNGGNIESGATYKSGSLSGAGSSFNLPGFTGHTAAPATGLLGAADDLKKALIERIKNMVDELSPETRKEMGFSPTLYNYNGTPLEKLDGNTLRDLSEKLEKLTNK